MPWSSFPNGQSWQQGNGNRINGTISATGSLWLYNEGYVFHLPEGGPLSWERVQNEINRIAKQINADGIEFERFTPHCFRHTFATRAIENGMKPQTLKTIGLSTLSMTMDLYSHVMPTTKAEEISDIKGVLGVAKFSLWVESGWNLIFASVYGIVSKAKILVITMVWI